MFYNVHETLTVIVSSLYLFYVSFAGLGLDYKTANSIMLNNTFIHHSIILSHSPARNQTQDLLLGIGTRECGGRLSCVGGCLL